MIQIRDSFTSVAVELVVGGRLNNFVKVQIFAYTYICVELPLIDTNNIVIHPRVAQFTQFGHWLSLFFKPTELDEKS